ncbi:hypothetical protein F5Y16DRAFT_411494 [Xylariaceae sp. FL0255]|nr:hypothetical protein F5Y16DRAFT_411494 [Xylariaceae sp. FL0255]
MAELTAKEVPAVKRRKIWKGTRSCWESSSPQDDSATCVGCQHRRTPCVAQELPEELAPARIGTRHLGHRISKVEDLVKNYLASQAAATEPSSALFRPPNTPSESLENPSPHTSFIIPDSQSGFSDGTEKVILHHLLAAFPKERDARLLLKTSAKPALNTFIINLEPHSKLTLDDLRAPYSIGELPGPNTCPVIVARPARDELGDLSEPPNTLMRRLATAAATWVTTREKMHGTGVYEINSGNLRRAWLVFRRAMTVAQLMGLHRSATPPLKRIDPTLNFDPHLVWFRIDMCTVYIDRYLSSISMGSPSALQNQPPLGAFERQLTFLASRILERNEGTFSNSELTPTLAIDSDLFEASKSMPPSFWRPVTFQGLTQGSTETVLEMIRLSAQVYCYGLLIQLHLPYALRLHDNIVVYEYSKMACVSSSRETMTRFITHRTWNPLPYCSRPVDFFALLAGMTLLLAHLDTHRDPNPDETNFLAHLRLSDPALLSEAVDLMVAISKANNDVITGKSAALVRRLLDIEVDAASGYAYTAGSVARVNDDDGSISLHIPYLGVVQISRQRPIIRELPSSEASAPETEGVTLPTLGCTLPPAAQQRSSLNQDNIVLQSHVEFPPYTAGCDTWNLKVSIRLSSIH